MVNTRGSERKSRTPEEVTERADFVEENPKLVDDDSVKETPVRNTEESPNAGKGKKRFKLKAKRKDGSKASGSRTLFQGPALIQPMDCWKKDQKVNIWCKTKVLTILHQKMHDTQKKKLKRSFLANFWELPTANFPSQLLLHIIRRRVKNENKEVLTFNFEGAVLDFTIKDFAIITGLNCDSLKFTNLDKLPPSSIERSFFKKHTHRCLKSLIEELEDYDFSSDKMSLKLAKFTMLESIVIAKQHRNAIDDLHVRMVEDDDLFEMYPWGRVSFDELRLSIIKAVGSSESQCMTITGFAYALIYWAFEVIPSLSFGEKYARRISSLEPRILNWDVMKLGNCKELQKDVFNEQLTVVPLEPPNDEGKYDYMNEFSKENKGKAKERIGTVKEMRTDTSEEEDEEEEDEEIGNDQGGDNSVAKTLNEVKRIIVSEFASLREKIDYLVDITYKNRQSDQRDKEKDDSDNADRHQETVNLDDDEAENDTTLVAGVVRSVIDGISKMVDPPSDVETATIGQGVDEVEQTCLEVENDDAIHTENDNAGTPSLGGEDKLKEGCDDVQKQDAKEMGDADTIDTGHQNPGGSKFADQDEQNCESVRVDNVVSCEHVEMLIPTIGAAALEPHEGKKPDVQGAVHESTVNDGTDLTIPEKPATRGAVAAKERVERARNPSALVREPYTDAFGSAEPTEKNVPRKKRSDKAGVKTGAKKRKVTSTVGSGDNITVPPAEQSDVPAASETALTDGPSFSLGLTPLEGHDGK